MATTTGKSIAFLAGQILLAVLIGFLVWKHTNDSWRVKWLNRDAQDLQAQVKNAADNAAQEHRWQQQFAAVDADYQANLKAAHDKAQANLVAYRNGTKRLRESLNCTSRNLSDTATASGIRDAAEKCGLQSNDVEFLIQFASDAEDTRQQLNSAQELLRKIYAK